MRPHRLTLQAFGPFADEVTVDFDTLSEQGIFSFSGETGSGKTALLDGLCFSLFGTASGSERTARELRSDFARRDQTTSAELAFSVGVRSFRVHRTPRYAIAKRDGSGTTKRAATSTLWECIDGSELVIATSPSEVDRLIKDLLRVDAKQYRQTGILPQGEFRKAISGKPEEREQILRQLFDTWRYAGIEARLKQALADVKRGLAEARTRVETILKGAEVTNAQALDEAIAVAVDQLTQARTLLESLKELRGGADNALDLGRAHGVLLDEFDAANKAVLDLEAQRERVVRERDELDAADRAAALVDLQTSTRARETEAVVVRTDAAHRELERQVADRELNRVECVVLERAAEAPRIKELSEELVRLAELAHVGLDEASNGVRTAGALAGAARKLCEERQSALEDAIRLERSCEVSLREATAMAEDLGDATLRRTTAEKRVQDRSRSAGLRDQLAAIGPELAALEQDEESARHARERARTELDRVIEARLRSAASGLAETLEDGAACPVCGSPDHPSPALPVDGESADAGLGSAREALALAELREREAALSLADRRSAQAGVSGELGALPVDDTPIAKLASDLLAAEAAEKVCALALAGLPGHEQASARAVGVREAAEAQRDAAKTGEDEAKAAVQRAEVALAERLALVPESLRHPGAIDSAVAKARAERAELEGAATTARLQKESAARVQAAAQQAEKTTVLAAEVAEKRAQDARAGFDRRREAAGFATDEELASAARGDDERDRLRARIVRWDTDVNEATGRRKSAAGAAEGLVRPDLVALEQAFDEATAVADLAGKALGKLEAALSEMERDRRRLRAASADFERLERVHGIVGRLADTASGKNPKKLAFERYVMAAILDEVLVDANHRLAAMSGGRFVLSRRLEATRGRVVLELDVLDHYTGKTRRAGTLSGGEGFEAALSLALGLADTVQAQAGGVHLDSLFVDEGFGSLGSEDLDRVLRCLEELGGGRMIGLVSHVTELRERVSGGLVLEKTPEGSRISP